MRERTLNVFRPTFLRIDQKYGGRPEIQWNHRKPPTLLRKTPIFATLTLIQGAPDSGSGRRHTETRSTNWTL